MPDSLKTAAPGFQPEFTATGIGTLPHQQTERAVSDILTRLAQMPFWPQLPALSPMEDMNLQYARALKPLVAPDPESREVTAFPDVSREEALAGFYERLFSGEKDWFAPRPEEAAGLPDFISAIKAAPEGSFPWIKGHVTGPCTLAAVVMGPDGKTLIYDDEVALALAQGLGAQAAAQADMLAQLGRPVMIFVDEPFLSGYGSAFTPIGREQVLTLLGAVVEETKARAGQTPVMGVHCCGNTDWGLLVDAGFDVINLDSASYGENLLLYPEALAQLFGRGGAVAWGAVPTLEFKGNETAEGLWQHLKGLLLQLEEKGFSRETLGRQSLVTPACGMGSMKLDQALTILDLTSQISALAREEYVQVSK